MPTLKRLFQPQVCFHAELQMISALLCSECDCDDTRQNMFHTLIRAPSCTRRHYRTAVVIRKSCPAPVRVSWYSPAAASRYLRLQLSAPSTHPGTPRSGNSRAPEGNLLPNHKNIVDDGIGIGSVGETRTRHKNKAKTKTHDRSIRPPQTCVLGCWWLW